MSWQLRITNHAGINVWKSIITRLIRPLPNTEYLFLLNTEHRMDSTTSPQVPNNMAKTSKPSTQSVTEYIQNLPKETSEVVEYIRQNILKLDKEIKDHIKWNSPAFYFSGEMKDFDPKEYRRDLMVFNLHKGRILLVFPTGAMIKDETGILEGTYTDGRRLITITDMADAKAKMTSLKTVVKAWLKYTREMQSI